MRGWGSTLAPYPNVVEDTMIRFLIVMVVALICCYLLQDSAAAGNGMAMLGCLFMGILCIFEMVRLVTK